MDNTFIEHMVRKDDKPARIMKKIAFGSALFIVNFLAFTMLTSWFSVFVVASALSVFFFWRRIDREYEYIYTDGAIDVDVIYGQSARKRLLSADARDFQFIAWAKSGTYRNQIEASYDKTIDAGKGGIRDESYVGVLTKGEKTYKLIFEPDDRMVAALKKYIPRKFEARP